VSDDREALMSQRLHQADRVAGHRAFRGLAVVGLVGRLRGLAVSPEIRADDGEVPSQQRRHSMPRRMRPRVAVEQQDRRSGASMAHANDHIAKVDSVERKTVEHWPSIRSGR